MLKNNLISVLGVFKQHKHPITSVFDIGANKGSWTSKYDKILSNAVFTMFEANPKRNKPGKHQRHNWINAVLSSPEINEVMFYDRMGTGDSYYKEDTSAYDGVVPINLETTTIDRVVDDEKLTAPQIMKLDTQGSEIDILKGATDTLKSVDIIQIETPILAYNKNAPSFDEYINYITSCGFIPVGVDEIHITDDILMQLDLVFIRKELKEKYYGSKNFWRGLPK